MWTGPGGQHAASLPKTFFLLEGIVKSRITFTLVAAIALVINALPVGLVVAQQPIISGPYTQDFDTLAISGTSSVLPQGWAFSESGTGSNSTYTAGTGSSNTGDTYSFGTAASSERAFGGLRSGSVVPIVGVQLQNQTGVTVGRLAIAYSCEQWRIGVLNRGAADRLNFEYSIDATSLTTGTWTSFAALNCLSTVSSGPVGALDGNSNRTLVSGTVTGLNIAPDSTFWLRWTDFDITSSDDGLAIDDFTIQLQTPLAVTTYDFKATSSSAPQSLIVFIPLSIVIASGIFILRRRSRTA